MALDDLLDRLPALLKERRAELGLSQSELAKRLGVTQQLVGHWETGERRPGTAVFLRLLDELRYRLDDLVS
jgi:transcriptional regulator with XRE-family HTH domain